MLLVVAALLLSLPPEQQAAVVKAARDVEGVPYDLGGRLQKDRGLDCQGLVFYALQPIAKCGWKSWSVLPTTSVKGELGLPVPGLAPVLAADVEKSLALFQPGDVLWFLDPTENPAEPALTSIGEVPHWVWHTALYTGDGHFIAGEPSWPDGAGGAVVDQVLVDYVVAHYAGVFVTRMERGPQAHGKCRRHAPMKKAQPGL